MTQSITIGGNDSPVKFNKRALSNFEKKSGTRLAELSDKMTIDHMAILALCGLQEGAKLEGKIFNLTLDKLYDLDAQHDCIDSIIALFEDVEKKQMPS